MIQILLSSYNGARWLPEQLSSLDAQTHADWELLARDDGSTDSSQALLETYIQTRGRGRVLAGPNLGYLNSFFTLLKESTAPAVAFCDQDDVWLPHRLERAATSLATIPPNEPGLHFSPFIVVDESLQPIQARTGGGTRFAFANALAECAAYGLTMTMNAAARDLITSRLPRDPISHDWWCYLVVSATGRVLREPEPMVLYRRHTQNASQGSHRSIWQKAQRFVREGAGRRVYRQAEELEANFGNHMHKAARQTLHRFLAAGQSRRAGLRYALHPEIAREAPLDNLALRLLIATKRL